MRKNRGKLFGAAIGYTMGGPIGALLGTPLNPMEIGAIRNFFAELYGNGRIRSTLIDRLVDDALAAGAVDPSVCRRVVHETVYEQRLFLVQLGFRIASADGTVNAAETEFIGACAGYMEVQGYDFEVLRREWSRRSGPEDTDAASAGDASNGAGAVDEYHILGVSSTCTEEELTRSYRKLVAMYHPDRVTHLGPEFVDLATRRFREIQRAYEKIRKTRGAHGGRTD
jgi:DnaJ like chaperone protein